MGSVHNLQPSAFVVSRPRAADAIGVALRDVYARDGRIPDDMMMLLARLNDMSTARRA
jgi:hypothetical protein